MEAERLLDQYGDRLLRMCTLYLRDRSLAEDALQDTFLKALRAWPTFRGECSEGTFLTRIAVNVCKSYLRSPWLRRRAPLDEVEVEGKSSPGLELMDDSLPIAIQALSDKYREVIILYYYEEFSVKEISEMLHAPVSTVTARLSRARGILKEKLRGWYYDEP